MFNKLIDRTTGNVITQIMFWMCVLEIVHTLYAGDVCKLSNE